MLDDSPLNVVRVEQPNPTPTIDVDSSFVVEELPEKEPETITLPAGKTLRLLALEKFGNREFWVYIYLKNRDKIANPNKVPVGTKLVIPEITEYGIDSSNSQSVAKAKALGDEELKRF